MKTASGALSSSSPYTFERLTIAAWWQAQTVTTGVSHDSKKQIAKGCTFALDSQCFQDAALHVKLISGDRMLLERTIPTKSLQYTGQSFFTSTLHFGGINMQGTAKNNTPVPTITMVRFIVASMQSSSLLASAMQF